MKPASNPERFRSITEWTSPDTNLTLVPFKAGPGRASAGANHVVIQVLGEPDKLLPTLAELAGPLGLSR
jgi:hypothetical protein